MSIEEIRKFALELVKTPDLSPDVASIIKNAKIIDAYLLGKDK